MLYNQANMAKVKVLVEGFTNADSTSAGGQEKTCPTISLVIDHDMVIVVDPGALDDQKILVDALAREHLTIKDVTHVCITHSHIDHYRNVGMFPKAKVLEYFGLWTGGRIEDWQENFTDDIQVIKTPGHDYSSITLFVKQDNDGVVAICGDVFWKEGGPAFDPYASDHKKLQHSRELVLKMSQWIIPGHAGMYKTKNGSKLIRADIARKTKTEALGNCKKCHRPFIKITDKCLCQDWLCYHCCECEVDCDVCNCKVRIKNHENHY